MLLTPHEQERLLVFGAAETARRRRDRGLPLNHPEAVAVLTAWVLEAARDGASVSEIMADGRQVLDTADVMPGVEHLIDELQVEATFPDGTKLVTLHGPIQPAAERTPTEPAIVPGELLLADGDIELFGDRSVVQVNVENAGDRPVQVGSHFHFAEVNDALVFDRDRAVGHRLAVPAGTSVRFEPGVAITVDLVAYGGAGITAGFRGLHTPDVRGEGAGA